MSKKRTRRTWTAADKMRIVLAGMEPGVEISTLCRKEGVSPTQYYAWKSQLLESADAVFGGKANKAAEVREGKLEAELTRMKSVVVEITAENLELKNALAFRKAGYLCMSMDGRCTTPTLKEGIKEHSSKYCVRRAR